MTITYPRLWLVRYNNEQQVYVPVQDKSTMAGRVLAGARLTTILQGSI